MTDDRWTIEYHAARPGQGSSCALGTGCCGVIAFVMIAVPLLLSVIR